MQSDWLSASPFVQTTLMQLRHLDISPDQHATCDSAVSVLRVVTFSSILSSCHKWRYTKRSQKWSITGAALQVLYTALTSPLTSKDSESSTEERHSDWRLAEAIAEAVSRPGGPTGYLFTTLPPHAGALVLRLWSCIPFLIKVCLRPLLRQSVGLRVWQA